MENKITVFERREIVKKLLPRIKFKIIKKSTVIKFLNDNGIYATKKTLENDINFLETQTRMKISQDTLINEIINRKEEYDMELQIQLKQLKIDLAKSTKIHESSIIRKDIQNIHLQLLRNQNIYNNYIITLNEKMKGSLEDVTQEEIEVLRRTKKIFESGEHTLLTPEQIERRKKI